MKKSFTLGSGVVLAASAIAHQTTTEIPRTMNLQDRAESQAPSSADRQAAVSTGKGQSLHSDDVRLSGRARDLIRIGQEGIAREDNAALDAYFAPDFVFHGPGVEWTYEQLKAAFAAFRTSFSGFNVTRQAIIENGDFLAARTTMSGTFAREFASPFGPIAPTGRRVEWEINNVFRYDTDGRLVEEWVQYDTLGFFQQLGVRLKPGAPGG